MYTREGHRSTKNNCFDAVAEPFLQRPGLPFAEVLTAEAVERAFSENGSLFGQGKCGTVTSFLAHLWSIGSVVNMPRVARMVVPGIVQHVTRWNGIRDIRL